MVMAVEDRDLGRSAAEGLARSVARRSLGPSRCRVSTVGGGSAIAAARPVIVEKVRKSPMYSIEHSGVPAVAGALVLCALLVLAGAFLTRSGS